MGGEEGLAELCVKVLGPVGLGVAGGAQTEIARPQLRILLAILSVSSNRTVADSTLVDALWSEDLSRERERNLHAGVYQLRRRLAQAVPDAGERLTRTAGGYRLDLRSGELDAEVFSSLAAEGRNHASTGNFAAASELFGKALQLWRGRALADAAPLCARLIGDAERLEEQRLSATEDKLDCDLALGRHSELTAEIYQLVAEYPLRERLIRQLMLALYRSGRRSDALAAFDAARQHLAREVGLDPSPLLRELQNQMLRDDPALALRTESSLNTPGHGSDDNSLADLSDSQSDELADGAPRLWQPPAVPRQLPAALASFSGRQAELKELAELPAPETDAVPIAALTGMGGIGKTALAVQWAHRIAERFPDGQLWVNLHGYDPSGQPVRPDEATGWFLSALGIAPQTIPEGAEERAGLFRSVLADKRVLILLDNASDAAQVRPLLPGNSGCMVIVTSRSSLAGLAASDGARILRLGPMTEDESTALLEAKLGPERLAAEPDAVIDLVTSCGRLPLALTVAAARAAEQPGHPLSVLASQLTDLKDRLDLLDTGDEATSVRAVLSLSLPQLTTPASRMLALLAVHAGPGITIPAAASLAAITVSQARQCIFELLNASLINEHMPGRYQLHDLIHAYAAEHAEETLAPGETREAIHRGISHYLQTAAAGVAKLSAEIALPGIPVEPPAAGTTAEQLTSAPQLMAWLRAEHQSILAACAQAVEFGFYAEAWQLSYHLSIHLDYNGHWADWSRSAHLALDAAEKLADPKARAWTLVRLGRRSTKLEVFDRAAAQLTEAHQLFNQSDDKYGQSYALFYLASSNTLDSAIREREQRLGSLADAKQAVLLFRETGNTPWLGFGLTVAALFHARLGQYEHARECMSESLRLHNATGCLLGLCDAQHIIGIINAMEHRYVEAIGAYEQALSYARVGDLSKWKVAMILGAYGDALLEANDMPSARNAWQERLDLCESLGMTTIADQIRAKIQAAT